MEESLYKEKGGGRRSKRDQIVKAAVETFLENGYDGTSMNKVAEKAGVIKATIYSHFKDKEQLFTAIIEELTINKVSIDFSNPEAMLSLAPEEFMDVITAKFCVLMADAEYHSLFRVLVGESERFPELAQIYVRTVILRGMGLASKYLSQQKELEIKDPEAMAHIIAGSFISLMVWQQVLGGKKLKELEVNRVKEMLKQLLMSQRKKTI
ncbi:MAG: Fatty acid metabolism regulator protein [bacterium ADurb.Bin425]|nr:MAG: Fatty acid metabolism regulator protein [bacterium ADurb.Bin425]